MSITLEAIYEDGMLRPLSAIPLPDRTRVRLSVEDIDNDERSEWLAESERQLNAVWNNGADDVFNELLAP